jgi:5'(3')-deoxyribonucleotidase
MATVEINIPIFERNLKLFNKKGLRRSYASVLNRYSEYLQIPPLAATTNYVLEVTLDKDYVKEFQELLTKKGFTILGYENTYHIDNFLVDYEKYKEYFKDTPVDFEAVKKERDTLKEETKEFKELENDDVKFFFLPYNEGVSTLYEFINTNRDDILAYAKEKDITIMMKLVPFNKQVEGFFGFNFCDADQKEEVVVDYAARIVVAVDFNKFITAFQGAVLLSGIGETKEELADSDLNVHLVAENIKYKEA